VLIRDDDWRGADLLLYFLLFCMSPQSNGSKTSSMATSEDRGEGMGSTKRKGIPGRSLGKDFIFILSGVSCGAMNRGATDTTTA
jgi:hypothetical protein